MFVFFLISGSLVLAAGVVFLIAAYKNFPDGLVYTAAALAGCAALCMAILAGLSEAQDKEKCRARGGRVREWQSGVICTGTDPTVCYPNMKWECLTAERE